MRTLWTSIVAATWLVACTSGAASVDVPRTVPLLAPSAEPLAGPMSAPASASAPQGAQPDAPTAPPAMADAGGGEPANEVPPPRAAQSPGRLPPKASSSPGDDFVCWETEDHVLHYPGGACAPEDPVCPCSRILPAPRRKPGAPR